MTSARPQRRYWDACNWISLIAEDEAARADVCQHILVDAERGRSAFIITSSLTIAEVIRPRGQPPIQLDHETLIANFFRHEYILVHDVTRTVATNARSLARHYSLRPNDAIHLATALLADATVFETWNTHDFRRVTGLSIQIREPNWEGQLEMPETST